MPFAEIAPSLGDLQGMVRQCCLQLVEDGSLRVIPVTNHTLLGYDLIAMVGVRAENRHPREIAKRDDVSARLELETSEWGFQPTPRRDQGQV